MSKRPRTFSPMDFPKSKLVSVEGEYSELYANRAKNTFFFEIPRHVQIAILLKLSNRPLCRMRRTCSYVNNMVEENKKKFSQRNIKGDDVTVDSRPAFWDPTIYAFAFGSSSDFLKIKKRFDIYSPFDQYLSGCVIRNFRIGHKTHGEVKKWILETLKLSCENLRLHEVPTGQEFVALTDLVDCRNEITQAESIFSEEDLPALLASKNRLKMTITLGLTGDAADSFEEFKHLGRVYFHHEYEPKRHFENLMQFLYSASDVGEIKRMKFIYYEDVEDDPFASNPDLPPSMLLWDLTTVPASQIMKRRNSPEPEIMRYIDLPKSTKCILFVGRWEHEKYIYFVEKDLKSVFGLVATQLRISFTEEQEQRFLTTVDDAKMELLREMYIVQMDHFFP